MSESSVVLYIFFIYVKQRKNVGNLLEKKLRQRVDSLHS